MKKAIVYTLGIVSAVVAVTLMLFPALGSAGVVEATTLAAGAVKTSDIQTKDPDLLMREVSSKITLIKPDQFPLDTIMRKISTPKIVKNVKVEFESFEYRGRTSALTAAFTAAGSDADMSAALTVDDSSIWRKDDDIHVPDVLSGGEELSLHVVSVDSPTQITVTAVNGGADGSGNGTFQRVPTIPDTTELHRLGNAKTEMDSTTDIHANIPTRDYNYTQIHMCLLMRSQLSAKHKAYSGFDYKRQLEASIYDMRSGLESSHLYGRRGQIYVPNQTDPTYKAGGILKGITKGLTYGTGGGSVDPTVLDVAKMLETTFADNSGDEKRLMLCGKGLITALTTMTFDKQVGSMESSVIFGLKVVKLVSPFGEIYLKHHKLLDQNGDQNTGYVIDLKNVVKNDLEKLHRTKLELDKAGQQRVQDATRMLENSCLTIAYPDTHLKWTPAA